MTKALSIHVGLNHVDPSHYAGWSGPLTAAEADAEDMLALATKVGYETRLLKSRDATRKAVIEGIRAAAKRLDADGIFLLTFSGHGGQVPDQNGDEEDLQDETWCLFDGELIDDELHELWASFGRSARILVLSDSCHSGTVTRERYRELDARAGTDTRADAYRSMPSDVALRTFRQNKDFYLSIARSLPSQPSSIMSAVRLISGCQDNQLSRDGALNGLFTGTLLKVWRNGIFRGNYRDFHSEIVKRMPPTQTPNHYRLGRTDTAYDGQEPFAI